MVKRAAAFLRLVPMLTVMGVIFSLSHQPAESLDLPRIPLLDKAAHFLIYALLALTVLYVPSPGLRRRRPQICVLAAVLVCLLYGVGDEFHQSFIPGREASLGDIAADVCGAATAALLWLRRSRA